MIQSVHSFFFSGLPAYDLGGNMIQSVASGEVPSCRGSSHGKVHQGKSQPGEFRAQGGCR